MSMWRDMGMRLGRGNPDLHYNVITIAHDKLYISSIFIILSMFALLSFCISGCGGESTDINTDGSENSAEDLTRSITVPDLIGLVENEATDTIESLGLTAHISYESDAEMQPGVVMSQSPQGGAQIEAGGEIELIVVSPEDELSADYIVCLDPGHADTPYQIDQGTGLNTQDWANEPEIQIVFDIANRTKSILENNGIVVVMTKSSVYEPVDLMQRAIIANDANAVLILHIHTDPGISVATTFYPGASPNDWKGNYDTGRKSYIDPQVQAESERLANAFHNSMAAYLQNRYGIQNGGLVMENRGSTGTGNYGPIFSYDIWSEVPTFTIENNQNFATNNPQVVAEAIAEGIMACLN